MNRPKDREPRSNHFELSQEELGSLMKDFAQELVLHGEILENNKLWPEKPGGPTPIIFRQIVPPALMRDIFYPNDEDLIVEEGIAEYLAPYRLEPDDVMTAESISISSPARMAGTDIDRLQWLHIGRDGDPYTASVDVQYSRNDMRISPNDIGVKKGLTDERIAEIVDDMFALERPLTLDDVDSLRRVQAFIAKH